MFVKPKSGYKILDPIVGDRLPDEGREVPDDPYWQRRIHDGDVEVSKAPEPDSPAAPAHAPAPAPTTTGDATVDSQTSDAGASPAT